MRVLGLDPGFATTGFGVVARSGSAFHALALGAIRTEPAAPHAVRLAALYDEIGSLLRAHEPDAVAVERVFFSTNVRTAMAVGQAAGVALAVAGGHGMPVFEYTPNEVKQAVAGFGSAPKRQVQQMVGAVLGLGTIVSPADAADACALAICHLNRSGLARALSKAAAR
ncbi:MAG TPA: crossover junction endodeoxyribonuclease RuvC [Actinomycetota bacterium]|nr:crossover junction endodeoxyribonuclease RuvC [Actinomycetota bacterium]